MMKEAHIIVSGKVQGVFFRHSVLQKAREFDLLGWVKNLLNGTVEILAEGEEGNLKELINWCYNGHKSARVDRIFVYWKKFENKFDKFEILY